MCVWGVTLPRGTSSPTVCVCVCDAARWQQCPTLWPSLSSACSAPQLTLVSRAGSGTSAQRMCCPLLHALSGPSSSWPSQVGNEPAALLCVAAASPPAGGPPGTLPQTTALPLAVSTRAKLSPAAACTAPPFAAMHAASGPCTRWGPVLHTVHRPSAPSKSMPHVHTCPCCVTATLKWREAARLTTHSLPRPADSTACRPPGNSPACEDQGDEWWILSK